VRRFTACRADGPVAGQTNQIDDILTAMPGTMIGREREAQAIGALLSSTSQPRALILEGEAGIGKTTVWNAALDMARDRGFRVLCAQASQSESVLAYASLADLLGDLDEDHLATLPAPQRTAIDQVLLRADGSEVATDRQAVGTAFLSALERAAQDTAVLLAIDDLQWVDASSLQAVAFVTRRVRGQIGILATVRNDGESDGSTALQLRTPESLTRIRLNPFDPNALHEVIRRRAGIAMPRPMITRIHEISGGNPFYGLELARAAGSGTPRAAELVLPATLSELVESRIAGLEAKVRHVLLAVACVAAPTVEVIAYAADTDAASAVRLLEVAEDRGIIEISGNAVFFTHPLLSHGVYSRASASRRRAMHRRVAEVVAEPELRARHLALSTTSADPETLAALDLAAEIAFTKGAPASAAELLELAIGLGGGTDERRIRSAGFHDAAGDPKRARAILEECVARLDPGPLRAYALTLLASVRLLNDNMFAAVELLDQAYDEAGEDLSLRVTVSVTAVLGLYNAAEAAGALAHAERAVADATRLGDPGLLGQALGMRAIMHFCWGKGVDHAELTRAVELESAAPEIPIPLRPSMHRAQLLGWSGHFDEAIEELDAIRRACVDRGHESDMMLVSVQMFIAEYWRGNLPAAEAIARDTADRARMLDGEIPRCVELTLRCALAAHAGRVDEARATGREVIEASTRCGMEGLAYGPMGMVAMIEIVSGNYQAALDIVAPAVFDNPRWPNGPELSGSLYLPEGIEALIHLGRYDEAEPLIEQLEQNGAKVDRPWTLAIAARCRGLLQAERGDVASAAESAQQAMLHHERVDMPFEKARTQVFLGQVQRRQRRRELASNTLREAIVTFDKLGAPLWAARARDELDRAEMGGRGSSVLSPSEQRVAELAGKGMTNREVAAALFISPKTVDANMVRIYRKLGIHSRAELGRHMRDAQP